jgi:hypothetical protein
MAIENLDDLGQWLDEPELKQIFVLITGRGNEQDACRQVRIVPGTTAYDILSALNLGEGFQLKKPSGSGVFAPLEDVYTAVVNGQMVCARKTAVEIGERLFSASENQ